MSDISELERRISAALDRVGGAIERTGGGDQADLVRALEDERTANAQLEARIEALKQQRDNEAAAQSAWADEMSRALLDRDEAVERLKAVNAELRASNVALREANAAGLADPSLVNAAMAAELSSLKEMAGRRDAEIAEILATLEPLVKETENA